MARRDIFHKKTAGILKMLCGFLGELMVIRFSFWNRREDNAKTV